MPQSTWSASPRVSSEIEVRIVEPAAYEVVICGLITATMVPLSWTIGLLNGGSPRGRSDPSSA